MVNLLKQLVRDFKQWSYLEKPVMLLKKKLFFIMIVGKKAKGAKKLVQIVNYIMFLYLIIYFTNILYLIFYAVHFVANSLKQITMSNFTVKLFKESFHYFQGIDWDADANSGKSFTKYIFLVHSGLANWTSYKWNTTHQEKLSLKSNFFKNSTSHQHQF